MDYYKKRLIHEKFYKKIEEIDKPIEKYEKIKVINEDERYIVNIVNEQNWNKIRKLIEAVK